MTAEALGVAGVEDLFAIELYDDAGADVADFEAIPDVGLDVDAGLGFGNVDDGAGGEGLARVEDLELIAGDVREAYGRAAQEDAAVVVDAGFELDGEFVILVRLDGAEPGVGAVVDCDYAVDGAEVRSAFRDPASEGFAVEERLPRGGGEEEKGEERHSSL